MSWKYNESHDLSNNVAADTMYHGSVAIRRAVDAPNTIATLSSSTNPDESKMIGFDTSVYDGISPIISVYKNRNLIWSVLKIGYPVLEYNSASSTDRKGWIAPYDCTVLVRLTGPDNDRSSWVSKKNGTNYSSMKSSGDKHGTLWSRFLFYRLKKGDSILLTKTPYASFEMWFVGDKDVHAKVKVGTNEERDVSSYEFSSSNAGYDIGSAGGKIRVFTKYDQEILSVDI